MLPVSRTVLLIAVAAAGQSSRTLVDARRQDQAARPRPRPVRGGDASDADVFDAALDADDGDDDLRIEAEDTAYNFTYSLTGPVVPPPPTSPHSQEWPNTIGLCSLMWNEHPDHVLEWIRHYRWIGVETVYLRENAEPGSNPDIEAALRPYIDAGLVDFGYYPGELIKVQPEWYNDCGRLARESHSWVAFLDIDEFAVVLRRQEVDTEQGSLRTALKRSFRWVGSVAVQWLLFGSSGQKLRPSEGQLKGYDRCTGLLAKQMKCIGNTNWLHQDAVFRPYQVHQCSLEPGGLAVLSDNTALTMIPVRVKVPGIEPPNPAWSYVAHLPDKSRDRSNKHTDITDAHQIVLLHYVTRSQEEFIERKLTQTYMGKYATDFANLAGSNTSIAEHPDFQRLFEEFEHKHGLDGRRAVCSSGMRVAAAMDAAHEKRGWSALSPAPWDPPRPA